MTTDETPSPAPADAQTKALPTEALPTETLPTETLPTEAIPAEARPTAALPSDAPAPTPSPAEPWLTPPAPSAWATPASIADASSRPPIRWGGVVWGLLLVLFAGGMLFVLSAPERLAAVEVWLAALTPGSAWALWLAAAGVLIVVFALLGAIRSAQRRRSAA
jgi:hypothetical protein